MIRVRVPGSSANLGPGFDAFAAALALHLELDVTETGSFSFGTDLHVARDRRNLAVRAFARLHPPDRFAFRMRSAIPLCGGLGSSGAACVAGLLAADRVRGGGSDLLGHAIEMEGHPDNVAASLLGGITAYVDGRAARLEPPAGLSAHPRRAAGRRSAPRRRARPSRRRSRSPTPPPTPATPRCSPSGIERGDLDLVAAGLRDRIHQPYRAHLFPQSAALLERAPALGALGATISGAGPTVLVWARTEAEADVTEALEREVRDWARVMPAQFEPRGARVLEG